MYIHNCLTLFVVRVLSEENGFSYKLVVQALTNDCIDSARSEAQELDSYSSSGDVCF